MSDQTPNAISPTESLKTLFGITAWVVNETTKDFSDSDALFQPEPGGNCANWILGHIVQSRMSILRALGATPLWSDTDGAPYARGTANITSAAKGKRYAELLTTFNVTQEAILAALEKTGDTGLASARKEKCLFDEILFGHFHESYHSGQLSIIRRLLGKEGVIK